MKKAPSCCRIEKIKTATGGLLHVQTTTYVQAVLRKNERPPCDR